MISEKTLTTEWLDIVSSRNNKADKILIEKVIRALLLLEGLSESKFSFVFKGGTALMLMFGSTRRLSIDIDIIVPERKDLNSIFENVVKTKWFTRFSEQERKTKSDIPKSHYKFFYTPVYRTSEAEQYVLLDILFDKTHYEKPESITVDSTFVQQVGPPANVNEYVVVESGYKGISVNSKDVVNDIFQTSLLLGTRGLDGKGDFKALLAGITQIKQFIFSESYHIEKAIIHSAKASYLAIAIDKKIKALEKYKEPVQIKDWNIEQPFYTRLNKLKKSNPEAFFYWYKVYELIK